MSVLIEGMDMPTGCISCDFCNPFVEEPYCRRLMKRVPKVTRLDNCPIIEVHEPHGRLIDKDALHKLFEGQWHYLQVLDWNENPTAEANQSGISWCINTMHDDAPIIIPASEEAE